MAATIGFELVVDMPLVTPGPLARGHRSNNGKKIIGANWLRLDGPAQ